MKDFPQDLICQVDPDTGVPHLQIGEHAFDDLPIAGGGPIVERLAPGRGTRKPFNVAWIPVMFEGEVRDPAGRIRVVNAGEADKLDLPTVERPTGQLTVTCPDCHELVHAKVYVRAAEGRSNPAKVFVSSDAVERFVAHVTAAPAQHSSFTRPVDAAADPGTAIVHSGDDGVRTVVHADPVIRISPEDRERLGAAVFEPDGTLRLDTAGEYRYRLARFEGDDHIYERVTVQP